MRSAIALVLCLVSYCFTATNGENCAAGCFKELRDDTTQTCNCCHQTASTVDPCKGFKCGRGEECVRKEVGCSNAFGRNCVHNVRAECKKSCETKNCGSSDLEVYNLDGCKQCWRNAGRNNVCQGFTGCNPDQECYIECSDPNNCNPIAFCRKKCEKVQCPAGCIEYKDSEGCSRCSCCNACLNKKCAATEECVLATDPSSIGMNDLSKAMVAKCQKKT